MTRKIPIEGGNAEPVAISSPELDIALSALRDAILGAGDKTLTDLWGELASTLSVSDATSHTVLGNILTALGPLATDSKLEAVRALLAGTLTVSGPLTDTQLRASAVPVQGFAAVGAPPSNYPVAVSGKDPSGNKQHVLVDASGNLYVKQLPLLTQAFSISTAATGQQLAVSDGYNSWSVTIDTATVTGQAFTFQFSPDNGTNWYPLVMYPQTASTAPSTNGNSTGAQWDGPVPRGVTHVRFYVNTLSTGTLTGKIIASPAPVNIPSLLIAFNYAQASNARAGYHSAPKIRYSETTSALTTASPSFTGSWRDVFAAAAGSASASGSENGKLVTYRCFGDNPFDIYVDESEDQTTNPRWLKVSATATGSVYGATIQFSPTARYCRLYAVKTGSDLTYFRAFSKFEAA